MRLIPCILATVVLLAGCANLEYRDTNAAVDARPECAGVDNARPGEGVPGWCERSSEAEWSNSGSTKVQFGTGDED